MKAQLVKRFEDEIQTLERELKSELPKEIQRARELGDLRENAEYQAAKDRQTFVNARIAMLKRRVAELSMLNLDRIPEGKVGLGSTVHVRDSTGEVVIYRLVMPEDANPASGLITTASPIGRSLLNSEEGDDVTAQTPTGKRAFEVIKVITIHDEPES